MSLKSVIKSNFHTQQEEYQEVLLLDQTSDSNKLILWNDEVNTFDFVILCLVEICKHTPEQAEQCTMLVHFKGKCTVKTGTKEDLLPMHEKLISRGLTSEIQ